ncbi:Glycosyltransferase involved in cell wall bisynthesis [Flaviramulus basaltis]|uniref:Glycosyltransferase involved in cell wall bisynthesis n=1 Tax=Flaviramulus basaltis TaxID=369401 RepID=A0A1K2IKD6_9FLAO|nr:glycosyltransferase family 4 protein [Flaviramulus basaltis]SFZ92917.1 Glycosyltransferase involved in cell wall bisynthesis [Flaviramulus basaltis]
MKHIVYIGNKSKNDKKGNLSSIDILAPLLIETGHEVYTASDKKNILFRLIHMMQMCFKHRKNADYVLIDTYSTLNFYYAYFVSQLCRILRLKYIPILHGGNLPERLKNSPKLSNAIFKYAYKNIAPSLYIKTEFEYLGYNNLISIPNIIKLKNYTYKERTFDKVKLLWVRSFSKIYNPILAVKVLKILQDENIEAELCMVGPDGDGSLIEVKAYAKQLNLDVTFTEKLSKKEWIDLSNKYNIFINTTNFDNMPVSVIEAMALGLPIISTNVGGLPYLIKNGDNGVLVEPNSSRGFVDVVKEIISSPENTNKIALQARKDVEKFDWEIVKIQWIKLFQ